MRPVLTATSLACLLASTLFYAGAGRGAVFRLPATIRNGQIRAVSPETGLSTRRPHSLVGREWSVLPTRRRVVALTFDGGSNAAGASIVLRTLRRTNVRGTFFLSGRFVTLHPRTARAIAARYPVGNHSYDHPHMTALSDASVRTEIVRARRIISRVTGQNPRPLFRFPYGDVNFRVIGIANRLGYDSIRWTIDTLGWEGVSAGQSLASVASRVREGLRPGAIVLMHLGSSPDHSTLDAHALASVIALIRARGYSFVTLDQFFSRGRKELARRRSDQSSK